MSHVLLYKFLVMKHIFTGVEASAGKFQLLVANRHM